jgi:hypothetical protein
MEQAIQFIHGNNRYAFKDIKIGQYKVELRNKNWFIVGYTTQENAGEAYSATVTSQFLMKHGNQVGHGINNMHKITLCRQQLYGCKPMPKWRISSGRAMRQLSLQI